VSLAVKGLRFSNLGEHCTSVRIPLVIDLGTAIGSRGGLAKLSQEERELGLLMP